ncbi:MAG: O-methyltransferase [Nitrospirae bacterium]|nr:O-methyltransferase [Nitrospirota bacterium]
MDIVNSDIERYLADLFPSTDPVLKEMERLAEREEFPIVGPLVGRLLALMARLVNARRVFEFGSGFGYSAFWFLQGMGEQGTVVMTDDEEANAARARDYFKQAGLSDRAAINVGDAFDIIDQQPGPFDIILVDCEKARYPLAFEKALPKLRSGGLLIADNVLWFGKVLKRSEEPSTIGVQQFTRLITTDTRLTTTILPLRDGVSISCKR